MAQKCFEPGCSYLIEKKCPVNLYIFRLTFLLGQIFLPLLANASRRFKVRLHGYALLPDRYIIAVSTLPDYDPEHDNFMPVNIPNFGEPPEKKDHRVESVFSYIPGLLTQLNTNLNHYLRIGMERATPIFAKGYSKKKIHNANEAILAYVEILTKAQQLGFSENNDYFEDAIMPLERIGDERQIIFTKPNFVKKKAKMAEYIPLSLPLFPELQDYDAKTVQEIVSKHVERVRSELLQTREQIEKPNLTPDEIGSLPHPQTPLFATEDFAFDHFPIVFDYKGLLELSEQHEIDELENAQRQWLKAWRKHYQYALRKWRMGLRDTPFPIGTCKMRAIHNCQISSVLQI